MSLVGTALILAWVAIILLALSVAGLMRQVHLLLLRDESSGDPLKPPAAATSVPPLLAAPDGTRLVLFASPSCVTCFEALAELVAHGEASMGNQAPERLSAPNLAYTVVTAGDRHPSWPPQLQYVEHAADLFARFGVVATPHALKVVGDQVVDTAPVGSITALRRLLADLPAAAFQPAEGRQP